MFPVNETANVATFAVKIQPRAPERNHRNRGEALKLSLTAPPVDGKANQPVMEFFADWFEIARSQVTITSGETSRNKLIRITGVPARQLRERLIAAGLSDAGE